MARASMTTRVMKEALMIAAVALVTSSVLLAGVAYAGPVIDLTQGVQAKH